MTWYTYIGVSEIKLPEPISNIIWSEETSNGKASRKDKYTNIQAFNKDVRLTKTMANNCTNHFTGAYLYNLKNSSINNVLNKNLELKVKLNITRNQTWMWQEYYLISNY